MRFTQRAAAILLLITASSASPVAHLLPKPRHYGSYNQSTWQAQSLPSPTPSVSQLVPTSSQKAGETNVVTITPSTNFPNTDPTSSNLYGAGIRQAPAGGKSGGYTSVSALFSPSASASTPVLQIIPTKNPAVASSSILPQTTSKTRLTAGEVRPLVTSGGNTPLSPFISPTIVHFTKTSAAAGNTPTDMAFQSSGRVPASPATSCSPSTTPSSIPAASTTSPTGAPLATITLPGLENGSTPGPKLTPSPTPSPTSTPAESGPTSSRSSYTDLEPTIVIVTIQPTAAASPTPASPGAESTSSSSSASSASSASTTSSTPTTSPSSTEPGTATGAAVTIGTVDTVTETITTSSAASRIGGASSSAATPSDPKVTIVEATSTKSVVVVVYPSPTTPALATSPSQAGTTDPSPAETLTPNPPKAGTTESSPSSSGNFGAGGLSIVPVTPAGFITVTNTVTDKVTETVTVTTTM